MTENEAIERIKYRIDTATDIAGNGIDGKVYEDMEMAIKALEEIQQYQEIGTVEEYREAENDLKAKDDYIKQILWERDIAIQQLEEIGVSLGEKMDSVKEARERQRAKKVKNRKLLRDFHNRPYSVRGDCPNCGSEGLLSTNTDYCNACGQKLDWSDAP